MDHAAVLYGSVVFFENEVVVAGARAVPGLAEVCGVFTGRFDGIATLSQRRGHRSFASQDVLSFFLATPNLNPEAAPVWHGLVQAALPRV